MPQNMWVQASIPSEVNIVTSYGGKRLCDVGIGTHAVDMAQASLHILAQPDHAIHAPCPTLLLCTALARTRLPVSLLCSLCADQTSP